MAAPDGPSRITGEIAGSEFAAASASTANPMATAPRSSVIFNGRHPGINPFYPDNPAGNPPPLAGNENYDEKGQPVVTEPEV
jgi:hypothetical protein